MSTSVVGIDFDNTLASYDDLIYDVAMDRGLIGPSVQRTKRSVRDAIRRRDDRDGEVEWQRLQAYVYGPGMGRARPVPGALNCVAQLRSRGIPVFVVSHKTEFATHDETRTSLQTAALDWMAAHGVFDAGGVGLDRGHVFFEDTRQLKIERIRSLRCSHFIDDLEEVLLEPSFPPGVARILFSASGPSARADLSVMTSWEAIGAHLLGG